MKVGIIGGTRGIGYALVSLLLEEPDIEITVLARSPEKLASAPPQLTVIKGDAGNPDDIARLVMGQDAVVSCIGVPITFKPVSLFSTTAGNIVATANQQQKVIIVTGIGAGETKGHGGFLYDDIFKPIFLKTIYADKDREEDIIRQSSLNWMIVRPAGLTNGPRTGNYRVVTNLEGVTSRRISRKDVADFIIRELKNPKHFGKAPLLTY